MTAIPLAGRRVEKPWGRRDLGHGFPAVPEGGEPVGEIVFDNPAGAPDQLLAKYLFTSQKLSIQVHPDDAAAQARGLPRGKDEAWVVLDAEPGSTLGIGLVQTETGAPALRAAALDGSLEGMIDWRPVAPGDCFYSPGGTIHAIGAGLSLIEIQQNIDLTYRLFDYGRPRELHFEEGLAVAKPGARPAAERPEAIARGRTRLAHGPAFQVERLDGAAEGRLLARADVPLWLLPLRGVAELDEKPLQPSQAWILDGPARLRLQEGAQLLLAYPGDRTLPVWAA